MSEAGSEKRCPPRRKVLKGAKAIFHDSASLYDCQVRDWSDSGARLVFPELTPLPKLFTLHLSDGSEHSCEVVRADGVIVGVHFTTKV